MINNSDNSNTSNASNTLGEGMRRGEEQGVRQGMRHLRRAALPPVCKIPQGTRGTGPCDTPSPPIKSLGFRGFDSSRLFIIRGGNSHVRSIL